MTKKLNSKPDPKKRRTIAFLAMTPVPELDLFGPVEIFKTANVLNQNYEIVLISASKSKRLIGASGIEVLALCHFTEFNRPIDTLMVLGDPKSSVGLSPALVNWLRGYAKKARRICSVCTGAFVLAEAGILNGKKVTTHWLYEARFKEKFPAVELDIASIWTKDGNIYTSAGVSTGIDLSLALVEEDCGVQIAIKIAKGLVLPLRRSGTQKQFSQLLSAESNLKNDLGDLPAWLLENIQNNLSVEKIAEKVGMSPRNFARQFEQAFKMGPGEYVRKMRIEEAKRCLESALFSWKEVAARCGMDSEALRRAFIRELGLSPQNYLAHYRLRG